MSVRRIVLLAVVASSLLLVPAAWSDPLIRSNVKGNCPRQPHTVAKPHGDTYFVHKGWLYGCDNYGDAVDGSPRHDLARLGPWTGHHVAAFGLEFAAWTIRSTGADGQLADTVYGAFAGSGPWKRTSTAVIGPTSATDRLVTKIVVKSNAAAWVTNGGAMMLWVNDPNVVAPPVLIGEGTAGASPPPSASPGDQLGLLSPTPTSDGLFALAGRWPSTPAAALGSTLKLTEQTTTDATACHEQDTWSATVQPLAAQPPVGISWQRNYESDDDC